MRSNGFTTILFRSVAAAGLSVVLTVPALAQIAGCPDKLGDRADAAVAQVTTWNAFVSWHHAYAVCDDGDTAEGIDSATARLLAAKWPELMRVGNVFRRDPGLQKFLVRHINAVGLTRDAASSLEQRAGAQCPAVNAGLCRAIAEAAKTTVAENSGK